MKGVKSVFFVPRTKHKVYKRFSHVLHLNTLILESSTFSFAATQVLPRTTQADHPKITSHHPFKHNFIEIFFSKVQHSLNKIWMCSDYFCDSISVCTYVPFTVSNFCVYCNDKSFNVGLLLYCCYYRKVFSDWRPAFLSFSLHVSLYLCSCHLNCHIHHQSMIINTIIEESKSFGNIYPRIRTSSGTNSECGWMSTK